MDQSQIIGIRESTVNLFLSFFNFSVLRKYNTVEDYIMHEHRILDHCVRSF